MNLIDLGLVIKKTRLEKGIPQEELCAFADISRATLSRLENGRLAELGIRKIMAVCERLGLALTLQPVEKRPTLRSLSKQTAESVRSHHGLAAIGARGPQVTSLVATERSDDHGEITSLRQRVRRPKKVKGDEE